MQLYFTKKCPICDYDLSDSGFGLTCSFCNRYYNYTYKVVVRTLSYRLDFLKDKTDVYKYNNSLNPEYVMSLPDNFELDWKNLNKADKRLKKLMAFI